MAIVCRKCAHVNAEGSQFCARPGCGEYLGWATQMHTRTAVGTASVPVGAIPQKSAATVRLASAELTVVPGATIGTTATVYNGGSQVEEFTVSVTGPATTWSRVEPTVLRIFPGEQAECAVTFAPPRHPSVAPGRTPFAVVAMSSVHKSLTPSADGTVDVGVFRGLQGTLVPQQTRGRGRTAHRVDVVNTGNAMETVRLQATDRTGTVRFEVPPTELRIAPGPASIEVPVTPPRLVFGRPRHFPFQVTVTAADVPDPTVPLATPPTGLTVPPVRLDGLREQVPLVGGWVPKVAVAVLVLAIATVSTLAATHSGPFRKASGTGQITGHPRVSPVPNVVPSQTPPRASQPPASQPPASQPPVSQPPVSQPPAGPVADPGAVGDLEIRSQSVECDFVPNGALGGGDAVELFLHVTWTGDSNPPLVPITVTTTSGDSGSANLGVSNSGSGTSAITFVPQPSDFGTTLQITITLDPGNAIPETNPDNNVSHVSFPLPAPRPNSALTNLPCSMT